MKNHSFLFLLLLANLASATLKAQENNLDKFWKPRNHLVQPTFISITPTYGFLTNSQNETNKSGYGLIFNVTGQSKSNLLNPSPFFMEFGLIHFSEKETLPYSNIINRPLSIIPANIGYNFSLKNFKLGVTSGIVLIPSYSTGEIGSLRGASYFNINPSIQYETKKVLLGVYHSNIFTKENISYLGLKLGVKLYIEKKTAVRVAYKRITKNSN